MSMTLKNPALKPSFAMPACGHAVAGARRTGAWTIPATGAAAQAAVRTYTLAQGVVDFGTKRGTTEGSRPWRSPDC
jgi:hypothetical protein